MWEGAGILADGHFSVWSQLFFTFFRQIVARTVLETLRVVTGQPENVASVLNVMNKLADDVGKCDDVLTINITCNFFVLSVVSFMYPYYQKLNWDHAVY